MRIGVSAADGTILCQGDALREGFRALGHDVVNWDDPSADFVFVGNPPFDKYLEAAHHKSFIFNVLDLAPHCKEHHDIVAALTTQLPLAAAATTISESVAGQIAALCNVTAKVIYYPMKDVSISAVTGVPRSGAAMIGRTSDPNKRCGSAVMALIRAGFNEDEVAVVGPEYPGWGTRLGLISDETLNDVYNVVDYVMMLSREEGIGLPAIEAACAGALPIVAPDLSTYNDFWAASPMHAHYQTFTSVDMIARFLIRLNNNPEEKVALQAAMATYANTYLRPKFARASVAARIIDVYTNLKS